MDSMLDLFIYNAFLFVAKNTGVVKPHIGVISSALPQDMLGDFHILNVDCLALCFLALSSVAKGVLRLDWAVGHHVCYEVVCFSGFIHDLGVLPETVGTVIGQH